MLGRRITHGGAWSSLAHTFILYDTIRENNEGLRRQRARKWKKEKRAEPSSKAQGAGRHGGVPALHFGAALMQVVDGASNTMKTRPNQATPTLHCARKVPPLSRRRATRRIRPKATRRCCLWAGKRFRPGRPGRACAGRSRGGPMCCLAPEGMARRRAQARMGNWRGSERGVAGQPLAGGATALLQDAATDAVAGSTPNRSRTGD